MFISFLTAFLFAFQVPSAHAQSDDLGVWPSDMVEIISIADGSHYTPYISSVVPQCSVGKAIAKSAPQTRAPVSTGFIPVVLEVADEKLPPKERETIVVIPGMFSLNIDSQGRQFRDIGTRNDYNTIVFPNPWSTQFVENAGIELGSPIREAEAIYEAIQYLISSLVIKGQSNGKVRLLGVSYGAFNAAIISHLDQESEHPLIVDTTLISPPIQLGQSMQKIDLALTETADSFGPKSIAMQAFHLMRICRAKDSVKHEDLARGLFSWGGFQPFLVSALKIKRMLPSDLKEKDVTFKSILDRNPQLRDSFFGDEGRLNFWLSKSSQDSHPIRILLSRDDVINNGIVPELAGDVALLNYGGHFGFQFEPWFETLMDNSF
ncbi:MAG: hypothetical protein KDD25_05260 [Bdellovibrionales bacterium]|nr:hypothetical protein [Bdellovibrionales bacterium]